MKICRRAANAPSVTGFAKVSGCQWGEGSLKTDWQAWLADII
ncbi:hypothetical protein [Kingella bonacorsii]|nr:hypothetical protein [Kingella bonacorsii]